MTSNETATLRTKLSYRSAIAAAHTIQANRITIFLAKRLGSRDSFLDSVTGYTVTVAVWDGKEYFLSSKDSN